MPLLYSYSTGSACFVERCLVVPVSQNLLIPVLFYMVRFSKNQCSTRHQYFMETNKKNTVTFIGDQVFATPAGIPDNNLTNVIRTELQLVIDDLYKDGKYIFLTGIRPGFDMLAAEVVSECTRKYKSIELQAVIPFPGCEAFYSDVDKLRCQRIYKAATKRVCLSGKYHPDAIARQMEYIVSASSEVVFFSREPHPLEKLAGEKGWNMYEELEEYFRTQSPVKDFLQDYPNVTSFRYGRKGLCFTRGEWLISAAFEDMAGMQVVGDELRLCLNDGTKIHASLVTDEVRFDPLPAIKPYGSELLS